MYVCVYADADLCRREEGERSRKEGRCLGYMSGICRRIVSRGRYTTESSVKKCQQNGVLISFNMQTQAYVEKNVDDRPTEHRKNNE